MDRVYFGFFKQLHEMELPNCIEDGMYQQYFARLYDRISRTQQYDINLYHQQAAITGGPILELGCGTGRILLRLAGAGYEVTGIDNSEAALDILEKKLKVQQEEVRKRVRYFQHDITRMSLDRKFKLAILPGLSLCLLKDEKEIEAMFEIVYGCLEEGGRFAFDYSITGAKEAAAERMKTFAWKSEDGEKEIVMMADFHDTSNERILVNSYAEVFKGEMVQRYLGHSSKRIISTDELLNLIIDRTGFRVLHSRLFDNTRDEKIKFVILEK